MDWLKVLRVYWPTIVAVAFSFFGMAILSPLRESELTAGLFTTLRWLPLGTLLVGMVYGGWVTYRLTQAERGRGHLCPRCYGPLGHEQNGRYGDYRRCLACGYNANERHYR